MMTCVSSEVIPFPEHRQTSVQEALCDQAAGMQKCGGCESDWTSLLSAFLTGACILLLGMRTSRAASAASVSRKKEQIHVLEDAVGEVLILG